MAMGTQEPRIRGNFCIDLRICGPTAGAVVTGRPVYEEIGDLDGEWEKL